MAENIDETEESYNLHEKNIYPDWDEDAIPDDVDLEEEEWSMMIPENEFIQNDNILLKDELEIKRIHGELLNTSILAKDYVMEGIECTNISAFSGYHQKEGAGLFTKGISMSLWKGKDLGPRFLVGISGPVSYVGILTEKREEYGAVQCELSFYGENAPIQNIPLNFYFLNCKQEFLDLLDKWAEGMKHNAKIGTMDRYLVLTNYRLNNLGSMHVWKDIAKLQNPLLYLITYSMLYHLGKISRNNDSSLLEEWLINNTIIPRHH